MRHGTVAIADQALISGVNFLTGFLVARYLSAPDYTYYLLLFAVLLFINGLQSALITSPLMVLAPRYDGHDRASYLNSLWVIQIAGCVVTIAVLVAALPLAQQWWPELNGGVGILPIMLIILTYLGQEFIRRVLFVQQQSVKGFVVDLISYGFQFIAFVILILQNSITLETVIWAIGLTSLASCVFGILSIRPTFTTIRRTDVAATWRRHWDQGSWLTASTLAMWSAGQLYFFVAYALLTPTATAILGISRTLLGASHIFLIGLENIVPAMATRHFLQGGITALVQWIKQFRLMIVVGMGIYCLGITLFADQIVQLFFPQYMNIEYTRYVIALVAVVYFIIGFARPPMIALRVLDKARWIFFAYLASALVTIVIAVPLVRWGGVYGAAIGMVITQAILLLGTWYGYWRAANSTKKATTTNPLTA